MENRIGQVIVVAYPAQGHINPLLQFAKRLASKGLKTTLATTPYTIKSIYAPTVRIEPISDGYNQSGFNQAPSLAAYLDSFKTVGSKTLAELILKLNASAGSPPVSCIVYDSLFPWALDVAKEFKIYGAVFLTVSASVSSMFWRVVNRGLSLLTLQETDDGRGLVNMPGLPPLAPSELPIFLSQPESETHSPYIALILEKYSRLEENDCIFCNSFQELETEGLWPLVMVGPMVPSAYLDQQMEGDIAYGASLWEPKADQCMKWLEEKALKSVVYVSFGSMAEIAAKQVEEIAWGLKASGLNFLWVVKDPEEKLPDEFLESVGQAGLVVPWCNQVEVLGHRSVGCFVTHGGWNSTLEGLSLGVPMVVMPQWSDQPTNAKFLELWGVGVRVQKNEEGIVSREEIEMCVREVMGGERSGEIKRNALKWREAAKRSVSVGGNSDDNINEFVAKLSMPKEG
ncbi:mogroside IE synthase-like isoform X2 [Pyrus communis]|uniref:mogroside IE synthase-like isoform X2 n=1 Tax=Pyrus communis TaxID=23211 RepID=UPI0035BFA1A8